VRAWARRAAVDLLRMTVLAGAMAVLFILGDLVVYGRVNW
jgi:hypothetical protein